jgi:hypothetical protein
VAQASLGGCGCGGSATDGDEDGAADCNDVCPSNPAITHAGTVTYSVTYTAAAQAYAKYFSDIEQCVDYAGKEWSKHFSVPHDVAIEVVVDVADLSADKILARCGSATSVFVQTQGDKRLFQLGAVYEILTGLDPNGTNPDVNLSFDTAYLTGTGSTALWFDPEPSKRTAAVPDKTVDALSVCMHELGHALGFSGWRDLSTGVISGTSVSSFDVLSASDGSDFFFNGPTAISVYGAAVPETYANINHVANLAPRPGSDLVDNLMKGVATFVQARYYIDDLDIAILRDVGLPVPGTTAIQAICGTAHARAGASASRGGASVNQSPVIVLGPPPPQLE